LLLLLRTTIAASSAYNDPRELDQRYYYPNNILLESPKTKQPTLQVQTHTILIFEERPAGEEGDAMLPYLTPSSPSSSIGVDDEVIFETPAETRRNAPVEGETKFTTLLTDDEDITEVDHPKPVEQQAKLVYLFDERPEDVAVSRVRYPRRSKSSKEFIVQYTLDDDDDNAQQKQRIEDWVAANVPNAPNTPNARRYTSSTLPRLGGSNTPVFDVFWNVGDDIPRSKSFSELLRDEDIKRARGGDIQRSNSFHLPRGEGEQLMFGGRRNLFFWKNSNFGRSMDSLNSHHSSDESVDSFKEEDEMEVNDWLETEVRALPHHPNSPRSHTLKPDDRNRALQRVEPIKSRSIITVKPERIASWVVSLYNSKKEQKINYRKFKQINAIPQKMSPEETYFVYCYFHGNNKWRITANVDKHDRMKTLNAVRRRAPSRTERGDLPFKEIEHRLFDIASTRDEQGLPIEPVENDAILYTMLETNDVLVESVRDELGEKRSRNVTTIAKWYVVLREAKDEQVTNFSRFEESFPQLENLLSEHERFVLYGLVYHPHNWNVNLDTNSRGKVFGVSILHHNIPEHAKERQNEVDIETRNILIKIALNDPETRDQLSRLGFQLPNTDPSSYHSSALPINLRHWERPLENPPTNRLSMLDFEKAFPEISDLQDEEKLLLHGYYHGDQNWNVLVQSRDGGLLPVAEVTLMAKVSEPNESQPKTEYVSYEYLDSHDSITNDGLRRLYLETARPESIASLINVWHDSPKKIVNDFEDFKKAYSLSLSALSPGVSEFEEFVVYALVYSAHKWRTVIEVDSHLSDPKIRLQLRHLHTDSIPFLYDFHRSDYLDTLDPDITPEMIENMLLEHRFDIPLNYGVSPSRRVPSLPFNVSDWTPVLNEEKTFLPTIDKFREFYGNMKEVPEHLQRLMFTYYNQLQQWDIVVERLADELYPVERPDTLTLAPELGKRALLCMFLFVISIF